MNAEWHRAHVMPRRATEQQRLEWHVEHQRYCGCRPMPARLQQLLAASRSANAPPSNVNLRPLLTGGDRRSIAGSNQARALVEKKPDLVHELAALAGDQDLLVVQRAVDLLEKLAHEHPDWIEPHKSIFIGPLADSDRWEIRLQIVRALPLFKWSAAQRRRVEQILLENIEYPQTFVRAWALTGLAALATSRSALVPVVQRYLRKFEQSSSKALQARARQIRKIMD